MKTDGWWREAFERGAFPLEHLADLPDWQAKTRAQVRSALRLFKLPQGAALLDAACGIGRHAVPFARAGLRVTGVDLSARYLKEARRKAGKTPLTLRRMDMRALDYDKKFDAAVCLYTSLGYFQRAGDDLKALRGMARALKPGGLLLLEMANGEHLGRLLEAQARLGVEPARWHEEDGLFILERPRLWKDGIVTDWVFLQGKSRRGFTSFVRLYTRKTLRKALESAGLRVLRFAGDIPPVPFTPGAPRLVALAQRSAR